MYCHNCGTNSADGIAYCSNCGAQLKAPVQESFETKKKSTRLIVSLVLNIIAIVFGCIMLLVILMMKALPADEIDKIIAQSDPSGAITFKDILFVYSFTFYPTLIMGIIGVALHFSLPQEKRHSKTSLILSIISLIVAILGLMLTLL